MHNYEMILARSLDNILDKNITILVTLVEVDPLKGKKCAKKI